MTQLEWKTETTKLIIEVINDLPENERAAFVSKHYKGMKVSEIASKMQLSAGEVSEMLKNAERRLSERLKRMHRSLCPPLAFGRT